jgi:hypothetical protein
MRFAIGLTQVNFASSSSQSVRQDILTGPVSMASSLVSLASAASSRTIRSDIVHSVIYTTISWWKLRWGQGV